MISEKERAFLTYWEKVRDHKSQFKVKLLNGLPMAALFALPILLCIGVVYFFFPEWYTKISNMPKAILPTLCLAVILAMVFFAFFRMHYIWESNEQLYKELKYKLKKYEEA